TALRSCSEHRRDRSLTCAIAKVWTTVPKRREFRRKSSCGYTLAAVRVSVTEEGGWRKNSRVALSAKEPGYSNVAEWGQLRSPGSRGKRSALPSFREGLRGGA
ncbi:unnamed protein product, partial [Laminaria digitata]